MATNANRTAYVTPMMEKIAAATSLCRCRSSIGSSRRAQSSSSTAPNTAAPTSNNEYATWKAYHNQYWPAQYIIDRSGKIVFEHAGEGQYQEMERKI